MTLVFEKENGTLEFENAEIGFRNFEGREGQYNNAGERSFAVFLNEEDARYLASKGWNIKFPKVAEKPDPDQDNRNPYLQVSVGFENFPAQVFIKSNETTNKVSEQEVLMLDWAELENVDLIVRPYHWTVRGNSGVKAYLKKGYFTIASDRFAQKYGV